MTSAPAVIGAALLDRGLGGAAHGEPQPRLDLGRAGGVEDDVVDAPVARDAGQSALGDDHEQRDRDARGAETRHSDLAMASSRRASTMTTSADGASTRAEASAGRMRTWCESSPSAGTTSALGAKVFVSSSRWAIVDQDRRSCRAANGSTAPLRRSSCATGREPVPPPAWTTSGCPPVATVGELAAVLLAAHPGLEAVLPVCSVLVGGRASSGDDPVPPGAVVEILPPFAGG